MTPSIRFAFTVLILSVSFSTARAQVGEPVDLVTNGGFELGFADWTPDARHELVTVSTDSHRGSNCLSGEVERPNQALRLTRRVHVRAGNRYEFSIWAKGTNKTKLVLWAIMPGSDQRTMLASWTGLSPSWRVYRCPISVKQDGQLTLEIISPSSHGAPIGRIWVDDIALHETEMPPLVCASAGDGFGDEPALATASDGSAYAGFNRFRHGADSLEIVRYVSGSEGMVEAGRWTAEGGDGTCLLGVKAVAASAKVAIVYACEREGNWDIRLVFCTPEGPSEPLTISSAPSVDVKPDAAWHDGVLWVAWESNRDSVRQVLVASVQNGVVSRPAPVSGGEGSSYDPTIAVTGGGEVCVAWHAFRSNNYDVYLRRRAPDGAWAETMRVTQAPSIDRHPMLLTVGEELWIVYENAFTERYYVTRTNRRCLQVAKITEEGLLAPVIHGKSVLQGRCEGASLALDRSGRMWLAMLKPRLPRAGWDVYLTGFVDGRWLKPFPISSLKGMDRTPCLAFVGDQAVVAFQADDMPQSWSDVDKIADASSDIYLATFDTSRVPGDARLQWEPLVETTVPFPPAAIRLERGEDLPTSSIRYQGEQLNLYYGDLHEHSDVSVCNRVGDQTLDESYQHLRDLARHDFVCITDHGYNLNPYLWSYSAKWARVNDDPGRFLTFLGQEWTSTFEETNHEHPHGFYGHRNLILADLNFPIWWNARNRQKPTEVWADLQRMNANFVHIPHQLADTGNVPTDWDFHDETTQPVAEIFQTRGSYEYDGAPRQAKNTVPGPSSFLQDAWAQDVVIGVIASPDHGGGYGKACVFAPQLTRESILDALRARRCYGTTAAKIFLDVRVNGHLMGEKLSESAGDVVKVDVDVRCPAAIDRIELCRDNHYIHRVDPQGSRACTTFVDDDPPDGRCYYYVRVMQEDEEIAWSSPVWFGIEASDGDDAQPSQVHEHPHKHGR